MSPLLAQSRHELVHCTCPLSGVKRALYALRMLNQANRYKTDFCDRRHSAAGAVGLLNETTLDSLFLNRKKVRYDETQNTNCCGRGFEPWHRSYCHLATGASRKKRRRYRRWRDRWPCCLRYYWFSRRERSLLRARLLLWSGAGLLRRRLLLDPRAVLGRLELAPAACAGL